MVLVRSRFPLVKTCSGFSSGLVARVFIGGTKAPNLVLVLPLEASIMVWERNDGIEGFRIRLIDWFRIPLLSPVTRGQGKGSYVLIL